MLVREHAYNNTIATKKLFNRSLQNFELKPANKLLIKRDSWFFGAVAFFVKFDPVGLKTTKVGHKLNGPIIVKIANTRGHHLTFKVF